MIHTALPKAGAQRFAERHQFKIQFPSCSLDSLPKNEAPFICTLRLRLRLGLRQQGTIHGPLLSQGLAPQRADGGALGDPALRPGLFSFAPAGACPTNISFPRAHALG